MNFNNEPVDPELIGEMCTAMRHRGPDGEGCFVRDNFGFGMRRLSIIDLETGDQPIFNEDKTMCIIFNGEIYNYLEIRPDLVEKGHRFGTNSDTEVVLHAYEEWGTTCFDRINGMFAFAIYDLSSSELFLARDRMGKKPLVYYKGKDFLTFGSENKAILKDPRITRELNLKSLGDFLTCGYTVGPDTIFDNIFQLPPGHWAKIAKDNRMRMEQYWDLPLCEIPYKSEEEVIEDIYPLIKKAVAYRLVSDVPVGLLLSSGMDSSSAGYILSRELGARLKAFTVGYENEEYDELKEARETCSYLGFEHDGMTITAKDLIDNFERIVYHTDTLNANTAQVTVYFASKIASAHLKAAIDGGGGDEAFCSYPTYIADKLFPCYNHLPDFVKLAFRKCALSLPVSFGQVSLDYRARKFTEAGNLSREKAHYWWRTIFTDEDKDKLFRPEYIGELRDSFAGYERHFSHASQEEPFLRRAVYADYKVWQAELMSQPDNLGMAHSLELRFPYLDYELVSKCINIPVRFLMPGFKMKHLLRKMMGSKLPSFVLNRKKRGTHVPISYWLNNELETLKCELLSRKSLDDIGLFDPDEVGRLISQHKKKQQDNGMKLWNLMVFVMWHRIFIERRVAEL